ncbi:MAG: DUF1648 domain-containing protein [Candidatus Acidiferrales bacterium]
MPSARLPRSLFFAIALVAFVRLTYLYPLLPDVMASHFGASGAANGWMPKSMFFLVYALSVALGVVVVFVPARTIAKAPVSSINLPNKDYWLAPGRRAETVAFFERKFAWFGCVLLLLEAIVLDFGCTANFQTPPNLPVRIVVPCIVLFVLYAIGWVIHLTRHFSAPVPSSPHA